MEKIFSRVHYRRNFIALVLVVVAALLLIRFFVLPRQSSTGGDIIPWWTIAASFIESLSVTLLVTLLVAGFIFWATPPELLRFGLRVVGPKDINQMLRASVQSTKSWQFKGACGRYTRAVTLPSLVAAAERDRKARKVSLCLLDPSKDDVCLGYAELRNSLSGRGRKTWTAQQVQEEVIATIVSALQCGESALFDVDIYLVDQYSSFRMDITDDFALITKEDPRDAALRSDAGTDFYNSYKDEYRHVTKQARHLPRLSIQRIGEKVQHATVKQIVNDFGLLSDDKYLQLDESKIIEAINNPNNPY